jgi:hypothetical protein
VGRLLSDAAASTARPAADGGEPAAGRRLGVALAVYTALGCILLAGAFEHPARFGGKDWNAYIGQAEAELVTLRDYGQLPLWNPWRAGGQVSLAQPVSMLFSPVTPLALLFGVLWAFKLVLLPTFVVGCLGTWVLAGHLGLGGAARLVPGLVLFGSSIFPLYVSGGIPSWTFSMALLPWLLYFQRRAVEDARFVVVVAFALAGVLLCGGVDRFFFFPVFLGVDAALLAASSRSPRPLLVLAGGLALGAGVAGVKLVPLSEVYAHAPREIAASTRYVPLDYLPRIFLGTRLPDLHARGAAFLATDGGNHLYWVNAGSYVGPATLVLALLGAVRWRRSWIPALTGLLFLWLCLGTGVQPSLWAALHRLPLLASMRGAERQVLFVTFCLALLAGQGVALLEGAVMARWGRRVWAPLAALLLAALLLPMLWVNAPISRTAFVVDPPAQVDGGWFAPRRERPPFRQGAIPPHPLQWGGPLYEAVLSNEGNILGQHNIPKGEYLWPYTHPRYRGEVYLAGGRGTLRAELTPNCIRVRATLEEPGRLLVNQNFFPGWRAEGSVEGALESRRGLLSLKLPAGEHDITLRYRPWTVPAGALLSLASVALSVLLLRCLARVATHGRGTLPATRAPGASSPSKNTPGASWGPEGRPDL